MWGVAMSKLNSIINAIYQGGLSSQEIEQLRAFLDNKMVNQENNQRNKVLPEDLLALLQKCSHNEDDGKVHCPYCGIVAIKNGRWNGRQRYLCRKCRRTFGDTKGTFFYGSKLTADQWERFIELTLRGQSLRTIQKDMGINLSTAFFNRHKLCDLIGKLDQGQDDFPTITETDEYYTPLSFLGLRNKNFFLEMGRMPNHHRNYWERVKYVEDAGYSLDDAEDLEGMSDEGLPSNMKFSNQLNNLPSKEAWNVLANLDKEQKKKRGISNQQVCVLTCIDSLGNTFMAPTCIGRIEPKHIDQSIGTRFEEDSIMVTDSLRAYKSFANSRKIHLRQIPPGKHTNGPFNLARVNSYHSRLDDFFKPYKEVSSKYLDHYLALFRWKDKNREQTTQTKVDLLMDMLTASGTGVRYSRLSDRRMPFDTKRVPMPYFKTSVAD